MSDSNKDPIGQAILDYARSGKNQDIIVTSDICDDDIIPSEYLFRAYDQFPEIEKLAISECKGKVLDIGAAAGVHAAILSDKGFKIHCIDISAGSIEYLSSKGYAVNHISFLEHKGKYDTLLLLMNGIGIAGNLDNLNQFLNHAKSLLKPGGVILCDSTDIKYLYKNEDGSIWMDLNSSYYGNVKFQMKYKGITGEWFEWLYVDFNNLADVAEECGLKTTLLYQQDESFLAKIEL